MAVLFLFFIGFCLAWVIYARRFHSLAKYPGPFLASVTRLWLVIDVACGNSDETQRRLHRIYGPIVRIAPNEVAIADPEAIGIVYAAHSGFTKTDFYLPFRASWGRYPDAFTNLDGHQHAERRRIVSSSYSMPNIVKLEHKIDRCTQVLMNKFAECANSDTSVDLSEWVQWYTFDVVGELFFSCMFGFLEGAYDYGGYIGALDMLIPFIAVACASPVYLRPLILLSGAVIPRVSKVLTALKQIESAAEARVTERRHLLNSYSENCFTDMLQQFFDITRNEGAKKDFGMTEVKMEIYGAFIAGSDTTAAAISAILYYLMRTPSAYERLTKEIDMARESGRLSEKVQYREAVRLPYLKACCKEAMRLHPSIGMTLPRYVPPGGCVVAGERFRGGTRVGVNAAVVQRDQRIFGDDADSFVPERWLGADVARLERCMFEFGGGARACIGKNISLCEIYKIVPQLLSAFHLELVEPEKEWETHNYWFNKPSKIYVTVRRREKPPVHQD